MDVKKILIGIIILLSISLIFCIYQLYNANKKISYLITASSNSFELHNVLLKKSDIQYVDWELTGKIITKKELNVDNYQCTFYLPSPLHSTFEAKGKSSSLSPFSDIELIIPIHSSRSINEDELISLINQSYFQITYEINKEFHEERLELQIQ